LFSYGPYDAISTCSKEAAFLNNARTYIKCGIAVLFLPKMIVCIAFEVSVVRNVWTAGVLLEVRNPFHAIREIICVWLNLFSIRNAPPPLGGGGGGKGGKESRSHQSKRFSI
jgi:hypothetical protein